MDILNIRKESEKRVKLANSLGQDQVLERSDSKTEDGSWASFGTWREAIHGLSDYELEKMVAEVFFQGSPPPAHVRPTYYDFLIFFCVQLALERRFVGLPGGFLVENCRLFIISHTRRNLLG